jgi:hypothetical protein
VRSAEMEAKDMGVVKSAGVLFLLPLLMGKCDPLNLGDATDNVKKSAEALERGMKGSIRWR